MDKEGRMERWQRMVLVFAGLAVLAGFFLPWRVWGYYGYGTSGYELAIHSHYAWWIRAAIGASPFVGLALLGAGFSGDKRARAVAMLASLAIVGVLVAKAVTMLIDGTGMGLWLVAGGAFVALGAGLARIKSSSR
jgi:O-antigen/teichoic acid export membrane protein